MITEKEMLEQLERGNLLFPPLSFRQLNYEPEITRNFRADALIEISWKNIKQKFIVEIKSGSTPKIFRDTINMLKSIKSSYLPMLIMPFLNEQQLKELEQEEISGIDLCGNGVVIVPGLLAILRRGELNRFPSSTPIKNVYRLNSSMVGRVFFSRPNYNTVQEIRDEINRRNILVNNWNKKPMNLSTVSKVLQTLEDDLIIERKGNIKILQPDKLLENLNKNFTPLNIKESIRIKLPLGNKNIKTLLQSISKELNLPITATGKSSVNHYTVMQREDILSVYCPRPDILVNKLSGNRTDRFPNLELLGTEDETFYFDLNIRENFPWASPIQVYLELMAGDKRDRETAGQIKSIILKTFN